LLLFCGVSVIGRLVVDGTPVITEFIIIVVVFSGLLLSACPQHCIYIEGVVYLIGLEFCIYIGGI
jgi:hypothetical protein